jgi:hypothetical protein
MKVLIISSLLTDSEEFLTSANVSCSIMSKSTPILLIIRSYISLTLREKSSIKFYSRFFYFLIHEFQGTSGISFNMNTSSNEVWGLFCFSNQCILLGTDETASNEPSEIWGTFIAAYESNMKVHRNLPAFRRNILPRAYRSRVSRTSKVAILM